MGLWSDIGSLLPFPGAGAIGGIVDKVTGVPTPKEPKSPTGGEAGNLQRDYLDAAYPGTTPWERLGSSANYGSVASSEVSARIQERLKNQELQTSREIADGNNRASIIASGAPYGVAGVSNMLDMYSRRPASGYDTKTAQEREKLPYEKSKMAQETAKSKTETAGLEAGLPQKQVVGNMWSGVQSAQNWFGSASSKMKHMFTDPINEARENSSRRNRVTSPVRRRV